MHDDFKQRKEAILQHNTITAVASRYNPVKKIGSDYVTICPWHDDTKPSLTIYNGKGDTQRCKCFACGNGGNVIDYYMQQTGADFKEAISDLSEGILQGASAKPVAIDAPVIRPATWEVVKPPKGAMPNMEHFEFGNPVEYWTFKDAAGEPLYYELRYHVVDPETGEIKKEPRPMTWGRHSKHLPYKWSFRAWPSPRPMYHLDQLAMFPSTASVVLFEGPRKADLAQMLLKVPCMSWSGGANAWTHLDLEPLRGRKVILFPDNDEAGINAMRHLALRLTKDYECACEVVNVPSGKPAKWDICDDAASLTSDTLKKWLKNRDAVNAALEQSVEQAAAKPAEAKPAKKSSTSKKVRYIFDPTKVANDSTGTLGVAVAEDPEKATAEPQAAAEQQTADVIPISEKYPMPSDTAAAIDWPDPDDILTAETYIPIQQRYLPRIIADYAMTAAKPLGGDPASLAMSMLVTIASAIDDRLKIRPDRHGRWQESARLWVMLCGASSAKKSPSINMATSHLKKLDKELAAKVAQAKIQAKYLQKTYDKAMQKWADDQAAGIQSPVPVAPQMPDETRLYAMDLSIEAFGEICSKNPRGMLLEFDEAQTFLGGIGQYKAGGGSDRGLWLSSYNGGPMRIDRIGRGSISCENFATSILCGTQPKYISEYAATTTEDGLLQRFVPVFVPRAEDSEIVTLEQSRIINAAKAQYDALVTWCVEMQDTDAKVYMADEARDISHALFKRIRHISTSEAFGTAASSALDKMEGWQHRVALVYHVIDCFQRGIHPASAEVSVETMRLVEDFVENFVVPSIITFYKKTLVGGISDLERVAKFLLAHDSDFINASILKRNCACMSRKKIQERKEIISQLVDSNWLIPDPTSRADRVTGLPTGYLVNTHIRTKYAGDRSMEQRRLEVVRQQMYREKFGWEYRQQADAAIDVGYMEQAHG